MLCFSFQNSNFHKISESNLRHSTNKFIKFIQIYTKFIQRKFFNPNYKCVDMFLPTGSRDVILNRANTQFSFNCLSWCTWLWKHWASRVSDSLHRKWQSTRKTVRLGHSDSLPSLPGWVLLWQLDPPPRLLGSHHYQEERDAEQVQHVQCGRPETRESFLSVILPIQQPANNHSDKFTQQ